MLTLDLIKPFAPQFKTIIEGLVLLELRFSNLDKICSSMFATAFTSIPLSVKILVLSWNNLGTTPTCFAPAFRSIPASVTSLDLSWNSLSSLTENELALAFSAIPSLVTKLNLSFNYLDRLSGTQLAIAFAALSPSITTLLLSGNNLDRLTGTDLALALTAIPVTITTLDLSGNDLYELSESDLKLVVSAVPLGVRTLNLAGNYLHDRTETQWIELLSKLPGTVDELIIDDQVSQTHIQKIMQEVRKKAVKITQEFTPLPPSITHLMLEYATNSSSFWNKNNTVTQYGLWFESVAKDITSAHNKVILR